MKYFDSSQDIAKWTYFWSQEFDHSGLSYLAAECSLCRDEPPCVQDTLTGPPPVPEDVRSRQSFTEPTGAVIGVPTRLMD